MDDLRFPIGKFNFEEEISENQISSLTDQIEALPGLLKKVVEGLKEEQLDTPYRPGGWTIRQLIHHISDSHMNAYIRFKLAMTEDTPTIKPYAEALWAELADSRLPVEISLNMLDTLHTRWIAIIRSLSSSDHERELFHPEIGKLTMKNLIGLYAWHGYHHLAHITSSILRKESNGGQ